MKMKCCHGVFDRANGWDCDCPQQVEFETNKVTISGVGEFDGVYELDPGNEPAVRYDSGKPDFSLIPALPLTELAKVYTYGTKKYSERNWEKGMSYSRMFASTMRHLWAYWSGEECDEESGLHHLAHAAFGCLGLIEFGHTGKGTDNRPGGTSNVKPDDGCM